MKAPRSVRWLWVALNAVVILGLVAYLHFVFTGSYSLLVFLFNYPGAAFLVLVTGAEVYFAFRARQLFDPAEPMRTSWTLIFLSACCSLTGAALTQIFSAQIPWNPLVMLNALPPGRSEQIRSVGLVVSGPVAMTLLAAGLARVIALQRRLGILGRLSALDKVGAVLLWTFTLAELFEIVRFVVVDHVRPGLAQAMLWFSDPLLAILLVEAVSLRRSVLNMGQGLVARCWGMMALAVAFTAAGDVMLSADWHGYIPPRLKPIGWFIWFFAATAYASAPSYQLEAARIAHEGSYSSLNKGSRSSTA
jgi:hypothetical protein